MPASRPSIPDRKRLDSDVRAFMRQPSTPWITFDRDSRVHQAEALGHHAPLFPNEPHTPPAEPSNVVVATDLVPPAAPTGAPVAFDDDAIPVRKLGRRALWAAAIFAGVLGVGAGSAAAVSVATHHPAAAQASVTAAPVTTEAPPPDLTPPPPEAPKAAPAPAPTTPKFPPNDPRAKLGRLVIRGSASYEWVFMDGKRMLGRGPRSFDVMCGDHTIAINRREAATHVDVPCMGEYAVGQ